MRAISTKYLAEGFSNKVVLITGHTGFKGTWLTLLLEKLGATIFGLSDEVPSNGLYEKLLSQSNFQISGGENFGDISNKALVKEYLQRLKPDYVFHLAAQSLVIPSYENPRRTWETNFVGSVNVVEAVVDAETRPTCIIVTTDKVYQNRKGDRVIFTESDPLGGGIDPYSCSKAAVELYIRSIQASLPDKARIGTVRGGNVIGGGDRSQHRLIPDIIRCWEDNATLKIRNPNSVRPWQWVLEPLLGYLQYALWLSQAEEALQANSCMNFGPFEAAGMSVGEVVRLAKKYLVELVTVNETSKGEQESSFLAINSQKARDVIGWETKLSYAEAVERTLQWYKTEKEGLKPAIQICSEDIVFYMGLYC